MITGHLFRLDGMTRHTSNRVESIKVDTEYMKLVLNTPQSVIQIDSVIPVTHEHSSPSLRCDIIYDK